MTMRMRIRVKMKVDMRGEVRMGIRMRMRVGMGNAVVSNECIAHSIQLDGPDQDALNKKYN